MSTFLNMNYVPVAMLFVLFYLFLSIFLLLVGPFIVKKISEDITNENQRNFQIETYNGFIYGISGYSYI